jgi:hypothetical protein
MAAESDRLLHAAAVPSSNRLVDNEVCAIDETWSGLRLVLRLRDRPG